MAAADAASREWAHGTPAADNGAVQEALDALDEASRENVHGQADATTAQNEKAALEDQAAQGVAAKVEREDGSWSSQRRTPASKLAYGGQ